MTHSVQPRERLVSLDVLRGLAVMGMILVNSMAGMFYGPKAQVFPLLLHAHWQGLTIADLVFPAFLTMVGVSIPIALTARNPEPRLDAVQARRIGVRTLRLVLLGFLLSNLYWFVDFESGAWRLFGVLQRIGFVYGACAILFLACGPKVRLALIVALLVLYWPLALIPSPDGLATDILQRGHNFVAWADRALLGAGDHIYVKGPEGYDPEGLLGTLPAIAQGLIGVAAGEYLLRRRGAGAAGMLALAGAAMLALGLLWSIWFPIIKDIWSSSFVLVTSGITLLALAGLHLWLDRPSRRLAWPLLVPYAFGINAIAAYVLHQLTGETVGWDLFLAPFHATRGTLGDAVAAFLPVLLYMAVIWAVMEWLRRKRWIVKI
jgi:predicted acyltransferase